MMPIQERARWLIRRNFGCLRPFNGVSGQRTLLIMRTKCNGIVRLLEVSVTGGFTVSLTATTSLNGVFICQLRLRHSTRISDIFIRSRVVCIVFNKLASAIGFDNPKCLN